MSASPTAPNEYAYRIHDSMLDEIEQVEQWRSSQVAKVPPIKLSKHNSNKLFPHPDHLWETCRRTGQYAIAEAGEPAWDPTRVWVDKECNVRLKTATFGQASDPREDRLNPLKPELYPDSDRPGTVQTLAEDIRKGLITKDEFSKMQWAIVYGGLRLAHRNRDPDSKITTYVSFANSGMLPCFHNPHIIEVDDPLWPGACQRGACVSHDGKVRLTPDSEDIVIEMQGESVTCPTPGRIRWEDGKLKYTRIVHGNEAIQFSCGQYQFRVMVFSPINPSPWTVLPWHQWLGFLVWEVDTLICDGGTPHERTIQMAPVELSDGTCWYHVPHEDLLRDAGLNMGEFYGHLQLAIGERSEGRLVVVSSQNLSTATVAWTHFHIISTEALVGLRLVTKCFVDYLDGISPKSPTGTCFNNRHAVAVAAMCDGNPQGEIADVIRRFTTNERVHSIRSWGPLLNPQLSHIVASLSSSIPSDSEVGMKAAIMKIHTPTGQRVEDIFQSVFTAFSEFISSIKHEPSPFSKTVLHSFGWDCGADYLAAFGRTHVMVIDPFFNDKDDPLAVFLNFMLLGAACKDVRDGNGKNAKSTDAGKVFLDDRYIEGEFGSEAAAAVRSTTSLLVESLSKLAEKAFGENVINIESVVPLEKKAEDDADAYSWADDGPADYSEEPVSCVWILCGISTIVLDNLESWGETANDDSPVRIIDTNAVAWNPLHEPSNVRGGWSSSLSDRTLYIQHESLSLNYDATLERYVRFNNLHSAACRTDGLALQLESVSMTRNTGTTVSVPVAKGQKLELHGRPIKWSRMPASWRAETIMDTPTTPMTAPPTPTFTVTEIDEKASQESLVPNTNDDNGVQLYLTHGLDATRDALRQFVTTLDNIDPLLANLCFRPSAKPGERSCTFADVITVLVASVNPESTNGTHPRTIWRCLEIHHGLSVPVLRQSSWHLPNHKAGSLRIRGRLSKPRFSVTPPRTSSATSPLSTTPEHAQENLPPDTL